jgi:hypothetical protein
MKISAKIWMLVSGVLFLAAIAIKLYFIPAADRFARLTIEEQMHRDMVAFEKIIGVVVTAAQGDKDYVRRALYAIGTDKSIPIELRRSEFLQEQFGRIKAREPQNEFEALALASGNSAFRTTDSFIEYAYPLKAQGVCMGCHVNTQGQAISAGTPVGLAVRRVPLTAIANSKISYFTLDLFWQNFALISLTVFMVLVPISVWILRPIRLLAAESEEILHAAEENGQEVLLHKKTDHNELHVLQRLIKFARRSSVDREGS